MTVSIARLRKFPPDGLAHLVTESEAAGHRFLRRLVEEWESGANRFDRPGEALFAAVADGCVIGLCGLNADPYVPEPRVGRVRHLYVATSQRRLGTGRQLVGAVLEAAQEAFDVVRLRTDSAAAARFYTALGFRESTGDPFCTHALKVVDEAEPAAAPDGPADVVP